jgi:hypothetical protein
VRADRLAGDKDPKAFAGLKSLLAKVVQIASFKAASSDFYPPARHLLIEDE